ncbi:DUF3987 domain-containing protein [Pseudooceanicola nanhaiensis]|uniref:DUF3987 domain-containing protein n=1 Tax=Pseudooceanicola nanhaiensis TaxID=375761 RepID=UPI0040584055
MNKPLNANGLLTAAPVVFDPAPVVDRIEAMGSGIPSPLPMGGSSGRMADFPIEALGAKGKTAARALHNTTQAPKGLCGQAVLCAMSTTVSSWGQVEAIHGSSMPISLFLITIAQSGERKTAVDSQAQLGIKAFEKEIANALAERRKAAVDAGSNASEALDDEVSDIVVSDPTYEGLLGVMARGPGFASLSNDDAAGFFGGHAMSRDQRQKTIAGLAQIWSGSDVKRPRAHGRDTAVSGVPLTMSLMFQPYLIGQVYGDREMVEQGILPRVLPCFPASTMGTRFFREPDAAAKQEVRAFAEGIFETLSELRLMRELQAKPTDKFGPSCPVLPLSGAASGVLIAFYNEIEAELGRGGRFEKIRGFASRAIENATRISAVIALFDDVHAAEVSGDAAKSACRLMWFYLDEFAHLLRLGKSEKDNSEAGQLGAWMASRYGAGGLGFDKDVSQFAPAAFRKKGDRQAVMQVLLAHRWIEMLPPGTVVDGAPRSEAFRVNPRIAEVL